MTTNPSDNPTPSAYRYAFIFGAHPKLSFAELEAVINTDASITLTQKISVTGPIGWLTTTKALDANALMGRLGGTIKIVEMIGDFDEEKIAEWLLNRANPDSKFHFGFSLYAADSGVSTKKYWKPIQSLGIGLKKAMKADGISARFVSSKEIVLSSVIVHKERLLKNGAEICLFRSSKGDIECGVTLAIQPFQDFSQRDYGRPQRDDRSGMLPPKLARMLVNMSEPTPKSRIWDPFCGSGTVLQEAVLMGFTNVTGSDKSKKAVEDTRANFVWMHDSLNTPVIDGSRVFAADATQMRELTSIKPESVDRIVFEGYLGPPKPNPSRVPQVQHELQGLYEQALKNLGKSLVSGGVMVAALPFWHVGRGREGRDAFLNTESIVRISGLMLENDYLYRRPQSVVGRHVLVLRKK